MTDLETRDKHLWVAELARTTDVITERLFVNCVIEGPAVLLLLGQSRFVDCVIETGGCDMEALLFEIGNRWCVGPVGLDGVVMEQCRIRRCGFMGDAQALAGLRSMPGR